MPFSRTMMVIVAVVLVLLVLLGIGIIAGTSGNDTSEPTEVDQGVQHGEEYLR